MNYKKLTYSFLIICTVAFLYIDNCYAGKELKQNLLETLQRVENSDWREKAKVINEITKNNLNLSAPEKEKLILIFDKESKFQEEYIEDQKRRGLSLVNATDKFHKEAGTREYWTYFREFAEIISSFKEKKTIPSLLRGVCNFVGEGNFAIYIIDMGEKAIEPLIDLVDSKDKVLRTKSLSVLQQWAQAPIQTEDWGLTEDQAIKDKVLLNKIKNIFLRVLRDKDIDIRSAAVYGLKAFPEEDVIKALEDVAKNDPWAFSTKFDPEIRYPIREDALRSIEKIKEKMKNRNGISK